MFRFCLVPIKKGARSKELTGRRIQDQDAYNRRWFRMSELTEVGNRKMFWRCNKKFQKGKILKLDLKQKQVFGWRQDRGPCRSWGAGRGWGRNPGWGRSPCPCVGRVWGRGPDWGQGRGRCCSWGAGRGWGKDPGWDRGPCPRVGRVSGRGPDLRRREYSSIESSNVRSSFALNLQVPDPDKGSPTCQPTLFVCSPTSISCHFQSFALDKAWWLGCPTHRCKQKITKQKLTWLWSEADARLKRLKKPWYRQSTSSTRTSRGRKFPPYKENINL